MWTIAKKEMLALLYSPRFILMSITAFILILLSLLSGYSNYEIETSIAETGLANAREKLSKADDLTQNSFSTIRTPVKLSIFDIGVSDVLGRNGSTRQGVRGSMRNSPASTDPALALFGTFDLTFIVAEIMALLALLFSYDSISGEKENGTLKAIMANRISRTAVFGGKVFGITIPVLLVFLVPFLAGLLTLLFVFNINFASQEWLRLGMMILTSTLYICLFTMIGITVSTLTKTRFTSLMLGLFVWIISVSIFPSLVIQGVTQLSPPMSKSEFIEKRRAISRDDEYRYDKRTAAYLKENPTTMDQWNNDFVWDKIEMALLTDKRDALEKEWARYDQSNNKAEDLAMLISIISPSAAYRNIQHSLADTGPSMLSNLNRARVKFNKIYEEFAWNAKFNPGEKKEVPRALEFYPDDDGFFRAKYNDVPDTGGRDISQIPQFVYSSASLEETLNNVLIQLCSLGFSFVVFLAISFVAFLRYDVR